MYINYLPPCVWQKEIHTPSSVHSTLIATSREMGFCVPGAVTSANDLRVKLIESTHGSHGMKNVISH